MHYLLFILLTSSLFSEISMNFVGDIMLGRRYICQDAIDNDWDVNESLQDCSIDVNEWCQEHPGILALESPEFISSAIREFIENADISNANLETVITNDILTPNPNKLIFHSCPEEIIPLLQDLGLDVIDIANNHIFDYLEIGMSDTKQYLDENNFTYYGAGNNEIEACAPAYISINDINIAYIGASDREGYDMQADEDSPGFCWLDQSNIVSQISNAQSADIIIYQMHSGTEYSTEPRLESNYKGEDEQYNPFLTEPSREDRENRQFAIDQGADIVVCHHPHVLQGLEVYSDKLIAHSLGNFIFDQRYPETYSSIILNSILDSDGFNEHSITPIYLYSYIPQRATGNLGNHILDYMAMQSRKLDTYIYVDRYSQEGQIVDVGPSYDYTYSKTVSCENLENDFYYSKPMQIEKIGSIAGFSAPSNIEFRVGREILWRGDFEFNPLDLGEFNEDEHPYLLFWSVKNDNENQVENIVDSVSYTGEYSYMHFNNNSGSSVYSEINNCFPINRDYEYTAKGYIKTENANNVTFGVRYFRNRCSGELNEEYIDPISGTIDWTEKYFNMSVPDETDYIDFRMKSEDGTSAYAYFDDLEIIQWENWKNIDEAIELYPNDYYYVQFKSTTAESFNVQFTEMSYESFPDIELGDVNTDNEINILDVVSIVGYVLGNIEFDDTQINLADYNQDGDVNILDIVPMVSFILGN